MLIQAIEGGFMALPLGSYKVNSSSVFSAQNIAEQSRKAALQKLEGIDQQISQLLKSIGLEGRGGEIPSSLSGLYGLLSTDPTRQDVLNPLIERLELARDLLTQKRAQLDKIDGLSKQVIGSGGKKGKRLVFRPVLNRGEKERVRKILAELREVKGELQSLGLNPDSARESACKKSIVGLRDLLDLPSGVLGAKAEEIPEEFIDLVTTKMMVEPIRLPCDHTFSQETVSEIECCPLCRGDIEGAEPDEELAKKIRLFQATNPNLAYGTLIREIEEELEIDYRGQVESLAEGVAALSREIGELQVREVYGMRASEFLANRNTRISREDLAAFRAFRAEGNHAAVRLPGVVHAHHQQTEELAFNERKVDEQRALRADRLIYERRLHFHGELQQWEEALTLVQRKQSLEVELVSLHAESKSGKGLRVLRRRAAQLTLHSMMGPSKG